jgi:3-carboxy-cis,cis-muconate cycloisomerase
VFDRLLVAQEFREATSDTAWLQALLDAEAALAVANARAGAIPEDAGEAIAAACRADAFDADALADDGRAAGNPVEPLVHALADAVGGDAANYVHWGATSQDILDTAAMLVARRTRDLLLARLDVLAADCARLADEHRSTLMAARTLLQHAVPTTFGLRAAGWLVAVLEARERVASLHLAAQLGGAAGTLAALGDRGAEVSRFYAEELQLEEPTLPWHTNRTRIAELAGALALVAGVAEKIARDVLLLSQTELAEVAEGSPGRSSTMPQKQNSVGSTIAVGCSRQVLGHVSVLLAAQAQEHERAAGAWHAEWPALRGSLMYTGGAVSAIADVLAGLVVDVERMASNVRITGDALLAEQASFARRRRETQEGVALELDAASYLGSSELFIDRALARYRGG